MMDWKNSPAAVLFFRYEEGDEFEEEIGGRIWEGKILRKCSLGFQEGRMTTIRTASALFRRGEAGWTRDDSPRFSLGGGAGTASRTRSFLPLADRTVAEKETGKFESLIEPSLLSEEQTAILNRRSEGVLLIRGAAGSGKTTVALHRLVRLAYRFLRRRDFSELAVFVPNKALLRYVERILAGLKDANVFVSDWSEYLDGLRKKTFPSTARLPFNESPHFASVALKRHPGFMRHARSFLESKSDAWRDHVMRTRRKFDVDLEKLLGLEGLPLLEKVRALGDFVRTGYVSRPLAGVFLAALQKESERYLERHAPYAEAKDNLLFFWEEMMTDYPGIERRIKETEAEEFHPETLEGGLEALKRQFVPDESLEESEKREQAEEEGIFVPSASFFQPEDHSILFYLHFRLIGSFRLKGAPVLFGHVMVDEGQEMNLFDLHVLIALCDERRSLTIAGDINQSSRIHLTTDGWGEFIGELNIPVEDAPTLSTGFRSTRRIMDLGLGVLDSADAELRRFKSVREGPSPVLFRCAGQGGQIDFLQTVLKNLMHAEPHAYCGVLFKNFEEAKIHFRHLEKMEVPKINLVETDEYRFDEGIEFAEIDAARGLEFDYVILVNVDPARYSPTPLHRRLLYVGVTRAVHQLWCVNFLSASPLLPSHLILSKTWN